MKISKENNEMVVRIPLVQKESNPYMDEKDLRDTPNLIGIIAGDEFSISHLNDLSYKGDQQEGMPILMFNSREELEKVCKDFSIGVWIHPICDSCKKAIRGSFTYSVKGNQCWECKEK